MEQPYEKMQKHTHIYTFVLYNPTESLYDRIELLLNKGQIVWVYQNSQISEKVKKKIISSGLCRVYGDCSNDGLGVALAVLAEDALNSNYAYMINFDQDTLFTVDTIDSLNTDFLRSAFESDYATIQVADKELMSQINAKEHCGIFEKYLTINSGSIFDLRKMSLIGFHDRSFFVDGVDYEYSFRCRSSGYRCGVIGSIPDIDHRSEQGNFAIKLFGKTLILRNYPLERVKDYNRAMFRLLVKSFYKMDLVFALLFLKHLLVYNSLAIVAKLYKDR